MNEIVKAIGQQVEVANNFIGILVSCTWSMVEYLLNEQKSNDTTDEPKASSHMLSYQYLVKNETVSIKLLPCLDP